MEFFKKSKKQEVADGLICGESIETKEYVTETHEPVLVIYKSNLADSELSLSKITSNFKCFYMDESGIHENEKFNINIGIEKAIKDPKYDIDINYKYLIKSEIFPLELLIYSDDKSDIRQEKNYTINIYNVKNDEYIEDIDIDVNTKVINNNFSIFSINSKYTIITIAQSVKVYLLIFKLDNDDVITLDWNKYKGIFKNTIISKMSSLISNMNKLNIYIGDKIISFEDMSNPNE